MSGRRAKALRRANGRVGVRRAFPLLMTGALAPFLIPASALALPQGGVVAAGSATVSTPTSTSMQITQATDRLVMDWTRFNIAANEAVRFQQPSAASIALNRVTDWSPSVINGRLSANGQIFLINPGGILFGAGSRVDVGALTASTLNITNQDFLSGKYRFTQDANAANAAVLNQGLITTGPGGYVALLGAAARNEGVIQANLGSVVLGAAKAATLDMRGDGLIGFVVTEAVSGAVMGPDGQPLASFVSNSGAIQAGGGLVTLSANAAGDVIASAVNNTGLIQAHTVEERHGRIFLSGGEQGTVEVSGAVDASGTQPGQTGGNVTVTGRHVGLFGGHINASGDAGGGTVLVGGDLHGQGTAQNAFRTYVSADSMINADAVTNGNGGKVIVWGDDWTKFYGSISARGGAGSGDGGFVEVSGKRYLDYRGFSDLRAPKGRVGALLLDPTNINIVATDTATADTEFSGGIFQESGTIDATSEITTATLVTQLTAGNVTINTNSSAGSAGDISLNTTLDYDGIAGTRTLTLIANNNIVVSNPIQDGVAGGETLNLVFNAGGATNISAAVDVGAGTIMATAGAGVVNLSGSPTITAASFDAGSISKTAAGTVTLDATTTANSLTLSSGTLTGSGNITVNTGGTFTWTAGTISGTGTMTTASGSVTMLLGGAGQTKTISRDWNNYGTVNYLPPGCCAGLTVNGTLTNQFGGLIDIQAGSSGFLDVGGSGTINNSGTVSKTTSASTIAITPTFNNLSTGVVNANLGTLRFDGDGTDVTGGAYNVASGAILQFDGVNRAIGSSISGAGNVTFGTGAGANRTHSVSGSYNVSGITTAAYSGSFTQSLTFTGNITNLGGSNYVQSGGAGTVSFAGISGGEATGFSNLTSLNVTGGSTTFKDGTVFTALNSITRTGSGTMNLGNSTATASSLTLANGALNSNNTLTVSTGGAFSFNSGTLGGSGSFLTQPGVTSTLGNGGAKTVSRNWTNAGIINYQPTACCVGWTLSSTLTNQAGGVLDIQATGAGFLDISGAGTILNSGIVSKSTSASDIAVAPALNNQVGGILDISAGILDLTGAFTQGGMVNIASGATLRKSGGFTNTGTIAGSGTVNVVAGSTLTNNGTIAPGGEDAAGMLSVTGNFTNGASGLIDIEIGGITAGTTYDVLAVSGTGTMGGTLRLSEFGGWAVSASDVYTPITCVTSCTGAFATTVPTFGDTGSSAVNANNVTYTVSTAGNGILWDGGAGDFLWQSANNWSGNTLPLATDDVLIDTGVEGGPAAITVTVSSGSQVARRLFSEENLTISAGSLALGSASTDLSTINGTLTLSGGTLQGAGTVTLAAATNTWSGGTMSGAGQTVIAAGSSLDVMGAVSLNRLLTNQLGGVINLTGTGQVNTTGNVLRLDNQAGGLVHLQNNNGFAGDDGNFETITNAGTLRKTVATGTSTISNITFNNSAGTLDFQGGSTLAVSGTFNHSGASSVIAGTVNASGGGSSSGSLALSSGTQVNLTAGTHDLAASSSITGLGRYRVSGGTLAINGAVSAANLDVLSGTLTGTGTLTVTTSMNWDGGTQGTAAGTTLLPSGAVLTMAGGTHTLGRRILNQGTVNWTAGAINTTGNSTVLENQAQFNIQADVNITGDDGNLEQFLNTGTVTKSTTAGTTTLSNVRFTNTSPGVLDVQTGTVALASGDASDSNFNLASGAFLNFTGGYTLNAGASITGAGLAQLVGSTLTIGGAVSVNKLSVPTGTVLTGAGNLTVTNNLAWSGGTMSGAGQTVIAAGSSLDVTGAVSLNRLLTNQLGGVINLTGTGQVNTTGNVLRLDNQAGGLVHLQNNNGFAGDDGNFETITNAGTLRKTVATGTSTISNITFNNSAGTLDFQGGSTLAVSGTFNHSGASSVIAGTVNASGGGSSSGSLALSSGTQVNLTAGTHDLAASSSITGLGRYRVSGGTLAINGAVSAANLDVLSGTLTGTGTLTVTTSMNWDGGTQGTAAGTTLLPSGAVLTMAGGTHTLGRRILNQGTVNWTAGAINTTGNSTVLENQAQFNIQADVNITGDDGNLEQFLNTGTVTKSTTAGTTTLSNVRFTNTSPGVLDVQTGTVALASGDASDSNFNLASGAFLNFTGGYTLNAGASITGAGLAQLVGSTLTIGGAVSVNKLSVPTGTVLTGAGNLTVTNNLAWSGGTMSGAGQTVIAAGSSLDVTGAVSLNRLLTNQLGGVINLTGTGQVNTTGNVLRLDNQVGGLVHLQNDNGFAGDDGNFETITNAGTLRKSVATGTSTISNITFNNTGTVEVQSGTVQINSFASGTNSGIIDVATAATLSTNGAALTNAVTGIFAGSGTLNLTAATLTNNGIVAPGGAGAAGTLSVNGNFTNGASGLIDIEIGGITAGTQYDVLAISGTGTMGGTLRLSEFGGWAVSASDVYTPITCVTSCTGAFATTVPTFGDIGTFAVNANNVTYTVSTAGNGILWDGGAGDLLWQSANNWSGDTLPLATDDVLIDTGVPGGPAVITVTVSSGSQVARRLFSEENLTISAGSLALGSAATDLSTINGTLTLSGGTLTGAGVLTLTGAGSTWSGGAFSGNLRVAPGATLTLNGGTKNWRVGAALTNQGNVVWSAGTIDGTSSGATAGSTITNASGALFDIQGDVTLTDTNSSFLPSVHTVTFVNQAGGELRRSTSAGTVQLGVPVADDNFARFNLQNAGTFNVATGTVQIYSTTPAASTGTFNIGAGALLDYRLGAHTFNGVTVSGAGALKLSGGSLTYAGTSSTNDLQLTGGTLTVGAGATLGTTNLAFSGGTLTGTGELSVTGANSTWSGGTVDGANLRVAPGATFTLNGASKNWRVNSVLLNQGNVIWTAGTIDGTSSGATAGSTITNASGALFDIQGDVTLTDTNSSFLPSVHTVTFVNQAGGELRRSTSAGTVQLGVPVADDNFARFNLQNAGTFNVATGTVQIYSTTPAASTGTFNIGAGALLDYRLGAHTFNGVTVSGAGALKLSGGSLTYAGTSSTNDLQLTGGTLTVGAGATLGTTNLAFSGGTLTGTGELSVTGANSTWSGGTVDGANLRVAPGATFTLNGASKNWRVNSVLLNQGNVIWTAGTIDGTSSGATAGSTITNASGALFDIQGDVTLTDTNSSFLPSVHTVTFVNQAGGELRRSTSSGTVQLGVPVADDNFARFNLQNAGTFNVATGTVQIYSTTPAASTGTFNIGAGALLDYRLGAHTFNGVTVSGAGALKLSGGSLTYAGTSSTNDLQLTGGTLTVGAGATLGTTNLAFSGGTLTGTGELSVTGANSTWSGGTVDGANLRVAPGATFTLNGASKNWRVNSVLLNQGNVIWTAGTIDGASSGASGGSTITNASGAVFDIQDALTVTDLDGGPPPSTHTLTFTNQAGGELRRSTNAGTATLGGTTGDNALLFNLQNNGALNINTGTLLFQNGGLSSGTNNGSITIGSLATLSTNGAALTNSATGAIGGAGTLNLGAATLTNDGIVAPGAATGDTTGTLSITGNYTQGAGGALNVELGGTAAGDYDVLAVSGTAMLAGALNRSYVNSYSPAPGDSLPVLTYGSRSGTFGSGTDPNSLALVYGATALNLLKTSGTANAWALTVGGDWNTAANWSLGHVPTSTEEGVVSDLSGTPTITLASGAPTAGAFRFFGDETFQLNSGGSLTVSGASSIGTGGTLHINGGTLTMNGALSASNLTLSSGTLTGTGAVTVNTAMNWNGGTQSGTGTTTVAAGGVLTISGAGAKNLEAPRVLTNNSVAGSTWSGTGNIQAVVVGGATINNAGLLDIQTDADQPNSVFNNTGTLTKSAGAGVTAFNTSSGTFNNSGTVNVTTGTLELNGGGTHSGTFNVASSAVLEFDGGTSTFTGGALAGAGAVEHLNGTVNVNAAVPAVNYALSGTGILQGTGTLTTSGTYAQSAGTLQNVNLTANGALNWTGGSMAGTGTTTVAAGGVLTISGAGAKNLEAPRVLTNNSVAGSTWSGTGNIQAVVVGGATINNAGLLDIQTDADQPNSVFNNTGTLTKSAGAGVTAFNTSSGTFNNSGTVNVTTGTLELNGGGTHSGTFNVASSAVLEFDGGTSTFTGGALAGAGAVEHLNGTVNVNAAVPAVNYALSGTGILQGTGTLTTSGTYAQSAGTLQNVNLTANGALNWTGGSMAGTGTTTVAAGGVLTISGAGAKNLEAPRVLTNNSVAGSTWSGTGNIQAVVVGGATINNAGLLDIQTDADQPNSVFNNTGTLTKSAGAGVTAFNASSGTFSNTGTIDVQSGTVQINSFASGTNSGVIDVGSLATLSTNGAALTNSVTGAIGGAGTLNLGAATLTNDGIIRPGGIGAAGTLNITGNYTQGAGGSLEIEIGGTAGGQYDVLAVSGTATLAGALNRSYLSYTPVNGDTFNVLTYGSRSGTFGSGTDPNSLALVYGATALNLLKTSGAANTWALTVGGDWNTAANWSLGHVPTSTEEALVSDLSGMPTITLASGAPTAGAFRFFGDETFQLNSGGTLTVSGASLMGAGSTLHINGGTLTMNNSLTVPNLTLSSGTLTGSGAVTASGAFNWSAGTIGGAGLLTTNAGVVTALGSVPGGGPVLARAWENFGTVNWNSPFGTGFNLSTAAAVVTNKAGAVFEAQAVNTAMFGAGSFVNQGTFNQTTAFPTTINVPFSNTGSVAVSGGTLNIATAGTDSGAYTVGTGATLQFSAGTRTLNTGASVSGAGNALFSAGTVTLNDAYSLSGTSTVSGAAVGFNGTYTGGALALSSGSASFDTPAASVSLPGLTVSGGTLTGTDNLAVSAPFSWSGGTITTTGAGLLTTNVGVVTALGSVPGGGPVLARAWENFGTVNWNSPFGTGFNLSTAAAVVTNKAGAVFEAQAVNTAMFGAGSFVNQGTFNQTTAFPTTINVPFSNTGSVAVSGGTLNIATAGTDSGAYTVGTGATLQFSAGTRTLNTGASVSGAGNALFSAGTVTLNDAYSLSGTSTVSGAAVGFNGTYTGGALALSSGSASFDTPAASVSLPGLTVSGGTLTGTDNLAVSAPFSWSGGTITTTGAGLLTTNVGVVTALGSVPGGGPVLARAWENFGTVNWNSPFGTGFNLSTAAAVVTNKAGAVFEAQAVNTAMFGAGSFVNQGTFNQTTAFPTTINVPFSNTGSVAVSGGTLQLNSFASGTNNGTIDVASGATLSTNGAALTNSATGTIRGAGTVNLTSATLTNDGIVAPGATTGDTTGTLSITGNYTQGAGGQLNVELQSATAGDFDVLAVSGAATLGGTLNVSYLGGYVAAGAGHPVLTYASQTGTFATITDPQAQTASYGAASFSLSSSIPLVLFWDNGAGDFLWTSALNWSTDTLPVSTQDVTIGVLGSPVTLLSGTHSIKSLFSDASLIVGGGSLTLANPSAITATLTVSGGTLTANGGLMTSALNVSSGTLNGLSSLIVANSFSHTGGTIGSGFSLLDITQASGNLVFGAPLSVQSLTATATAGNINVVSSITATGAISLTAQDLVLSASVAGSGALTLQPSTAGSSIGIGNGAAGSFNLNTTEIGLLTDGFSAITIGRADGSGHVIVQGPVTFTDPLTIQSPVTGGKIFVNGTLTGAGNASIKLKGPGNTTILNGNIVTAGNAIAITDRVILTGNAGLDTTNSGAFAGGAGVSITGSVNTDPGVSARSLTIASGTGGSVQLASAVGTEAPLQTLTITTGAPLELPTITAIAGVTLDSGGAITQTGSITTNTLTVTSVGGTTLTNADNTVSTLNATNTGGGAIGFTNDSSFAVGTVSQSGGGAVAVTVNTGSSVSGLGNITTDGGGVSVQSVDRGSGGGAFLPQPPDSSRLTSQTSESSRSEEGTVLSSGVLPEGLFTEGPSQATTIVGDKPSDEGQDDKQKDKEEDDDVGSLTIP